MLKYIYRYIYRKEYMSAIVEHATSPGVTIPIGGITVVAGFLGNLPLLINLAVFTYFTLMAVHKAYQMYKEWKQDHKREDDASC